MHELEGTRILVTGGAGFVGSAIVDRLLELGANVRVLDNLITGDKRNLNPEAEFIEADVRDYDAVAAAVDGTELVFHQAAQINPAKAVEDPLFDFDVNARGSLNVFLAASAKGVRKIVLASTNLYGDADGFPLGEDASVLSMPRSLLSPYAAAKAAAEAYAKVFHDEFRLATVRLRYTNVYGPRQLIKSESGAVAIFGRRALRNAPLVIFGDGLQTRDFVYVTDVAEANVLAGTKPEAEGHVFNIGTGIETSIVELAQAIKATAGSDSEIVHGPERAADFRRVVVDLSAAERLLGWRARTGLSEGLARYTEWLRRNGPPQ